MPSVTYRIVEHDGGYAYKLGDVFSESFPSHDAALKAAQRVAREQQVGGESAEITYQDASGAWRTEHVDGGDRPQAEVIDELR
jgi:hypothetical protein